MGIVTESVMNPAYETMFADKDEEVVDEKSASQSESEEKSDEKADESDSLEEKEESTNGDESESEKEEESDEDESEKEEEEEKPKEGKKPKRSGIQRRINKLNARVQSANEQAEYWRKQALNKSEQSSDEDVSNKSVKASESGKPESDDYESYDEYMEALADFKADQKLETYKANVEAEALKAKVADRVSTHNNRVDDYKAENADFDGDLADFFEDQGDDFKLSMAVEETITDSDFGPELLHELIKNPDEFERINSLGAMGAARAIGRLENKIEARNSKPSEEKVENKRKSTKAPKPLEAVKAKGAAVSKSMSQMTQKEYEAYRMQNR